MATLKDVVKSRIFGGKVTFRSDMSDEQNTEPAEVPAAPAVEAPLEAPAEEAAPEAPAEEVAPAAEEPVA